MAGGYDYVFWLGDLNYRVDLERSVVDQYMEQHHRQPEDWLVSVCRGEIYLTLSFSLS